MSSRVLESTTIEQRAALFSALGDPIRLRILDELSDGEKCVCAIQKTIEIAPNLLSYHLKVLRETGLVITKRRGRWVDYRISLTARDTIRELLPVHLTDGSVS